MHRKIKNFCFTYKNIFFINIPEIKDNLDEKSSNFQIYASLVQILSYASENIKYSNNFNYYKKIIFKETKYMIKIRLLSMHVYICSWHTKAWEIVYKFYSMS